MFTIKSRYVCVLTLLFGAFVTDARGESLPDQPAEAMPADTVSTTTGAVSSRRAPIDPFMYRVQNRHLEKGADFLSDSIKWYDHISLGAFSGVVGHASHVSDMHDFGSRINLGRPIGLVASYQFTRLHGVRLMYQNNFFKHNYRQENIIKVNEVGAGYMFNFTNYFKGYDPNARFNVLGTATAFATISRYDGYRRLGARGELGLLFNYRLLRNLSLFVEPYMGLTTDDYDQSFTAHRYDFLGGIRAGVATNGATKAFIDHIRQNKNDLYAPTFWGQNFFFGASAGRMWTNANLLPGLGKMAPESHIYLGYRFSPVHALRAQASYFKTSENLERRHHISAELDYMVNFTNMWRGYDPKRHFRVSGILGAGLRYLEGETKDKLAPMATAGLNFSYYITPQISLFAEPYGAVAFAGSGSKRTFFGGIRAGAQLDLIDTHTYMPHYALTDEEVEVSAEWQMRPMSHFFFGTGLGAMYVHAWPTVNHTVMPLNLFFGYRFTPVQALRLQASYIRTMEDIARYKHTSFELDYMLNLSNLLYGYKPSRRLNIGGYVGVGTKAVEYPDTEGKQALMFSAGGNVSYRLYKGLNAYVEPFVRASYIRSMRHYVFDFGANAGVAVNLEDSYMYGKHVRGDYAPDWSNDFWRHFFVGASGGVMAVHTCMEPERAAFPTSIFFGYRFSPNQALRVQGSYIKTNANIDRKFHLSAEVDYMLNFTNMFSEYKPNRLLNVIGYWGLGTRYVEKSKTYNEREGKIAPMGTMGVDVAIRLTHGLSAFIEPHLDIARAKGQKFYTMYYGANLGLTMNFEDAYAYSSRWGTPTAEWMVKPYQRLFFGGSAGWLRTQNVSDRDQAPMTLFMGYRFSPIHALRLKAGYIKTDEKINRSKHVTGGIDYMFNASNLLAGYKPNRPLNLIGFIGLGVRNVENPNIHDSKAARENVKMGLMGNFGMDIAYRLTRNVNLFVEPYVGALHSRRSYEKVNFFMGVNGGFVMNLQDIDEPYRGMHTNHSPIVEAVYGWMFPMGTGAGTHNSGLSLDVRVGTWIDPYFGIRGSLVFENYGYSQYYKSWTAKKQDNGTGYANSKVIKGRIEGLFNPMNLLARWRENADEKKFELNLAAGIELGTADKKYAIGSGDDKYGIYGVTFATQALFKVNPNTAIFIEPRYEHMGRWFSGTRNGSVFGDFKKDNVLTISGGVRVIRGTAEQRSDERRLNFEQSFFVGAKGGGYKALGYYKREDGGRLGKYGALELGMLITPVHGLKIDIQPSWYKVNGTNPKKYTLMDYRLSYLLNFSNLYQSEAYRKVDFYWQAGVGLSTIIKSPTGWKRRAPSAHFGFLVAYNINKHWAITTEPIGQVVARKKFLPGYGIKPRMAMIRADISVGTMWKF